MIKLTELMHRLGDENHEGLTPVDNWKAMDAMYLEDMGFKNDGTYYYSLKKPAMKLSFKKGVGFILEDEVKKHKMTFQNFKQLEEHFAKYEQQFDQMPYST